MWYTRYTITRTTMRPLASLQPHSLISSVYHLPCLLCISPLSLRAYSNQPTSKACRHSLETADRSRGQASSRSRPELKPVLNLRGMRMLLQGDQPCARQELMENMTKMIQVGPV